MLGASIVDANDSTSTTANNDVATANNTESLTYQQFLNVRQKKESERQSHFLPKRTTKKKQSVTVSRHTFTRFFLILCQVVRIHDFFKNKRSIFLNRIFKI